MGTYRVSFCKEVMGVPFPISTIEIRRARDLSRAVRAAALKFERRHALPSWRLRADDVACEGPEAADNPELGRPGG